MAKGDGDDEATTAARDAWTRAWLQHPLLFFAERGMRRTARYLREVGDLTREGSVEPRLWIGTVECFWSGVADDVGDYLRLVNGAGGDGAAGPTVPLRGLDPLVLCLDVVERQDVQELAFGVPPALFDAAKSNELHLRTRGLWLGSNLVLEPELHVAFTPSVVTPGEPRSKMRFWDLPDGLRAGMALAGAIEAVAHAADGTPQEARLVAIVQARII